MAKTVKTPVMPASFRPEDLPERREGKQPVIAIVGPTGSGKTSLSIELAKALDGEIISADSMQVYKGMDIGTAKVTPQEMDGIPHYLIDIQNYDEPWNVKTFQSQCRKAIDEIAEKGKVPILCGGTGLYIKAALYDYVFEDEKEDPALSEEVKSLRNEELWTQLEAMDPACLEKIHPNNRKRLERAWMIAKSGTTKSRREMEQEHAPIYDVFFIGLQADRKIMEERIAIRVDQMFEAGLEQEILRLFSDPKTWSYTSFQGIGYKEFKPWLQQECTLDQVREQIIIHSRQYAKRQMTWFRNQMDVHWFDLNQRDTIISCMRKWYGNDQSEI